MCYRLGRRVGWCLCVFGSFLNVDEKIFMNNEALENILGLDDEAFEDILYLDGEARENILCLGINSSDPNLIRKTYMALMCGSLCKLKSLPPWSSIKNFLVRCWREAFLHPNDTNTSIGLSGYDAALDFCPFLANGNWIQGYDEKQETHFFIKMLHSIYKQGDGAVRLCIETAILEGLSKKDLAFWRKCNESTMSNIAQGIDCGGVISPVMLLLRSDR